MKKSKNLIFAAGYCGEKSFLEKILDVVTELKRASPNCLFRMYEPSTDPLSLLTIGFGANCQ